MSTLFQFTPTSDESFEARLMAGGYAGYGSGYGATSTNNEIFPSHKPVASTSSLLNHTSNHDPRPISSTNTLANERTLRKERRLAAFRRGACLQTGLRPVEVEGRGRILLDFNESEEDARRRTRRRRTRFESPQEDYTSWHTEPALNWPDEQFPWNLRALERREVERKEEERRLALIEKFLEDVSDDDEDEWERTELEEISPDMTRRHKASQCKSTEHLVCHLHTQQKSPTAVPPERFPSAGALVNNISSAHQGIPEVMFRDRPLQVRSMTALELFARRSVAMCNVRQRRQEPDTALCRMN